MDEKVQVLKGEKGKRELEGVAEIVEVIDYLGAGDYLIWCVFESDKKKEKVQRTINIDEAFQPVKKAGVQNAG